MPEPILPPSGEIAIDGTIINTPSAPIRPSAPPPPPINEPVAPINEPPAPDDKSADDKGGEEDSNIDFNAFLKVANKDPLPEDKKKDEVKPDENKEKEKVDDNLVPKPEDKKATSTNIPVNKGERDYTGIDANDVPLFKKMGNEAFARAKQLYTENQAIKKEREAEKQKIVQLETDYNKLKTEGPQIPESYNEHPNAFMLTPEFNATVNNINSAQAVIGHWQQQLDAIEKGAAEVELLTFDPQSQQYVIGNKVKVDRNMEATIIANKRHAEGKLQNYQGAIQTMRQNHGERVKQSVSQLTDLQSKMFANFEKPDMKPVYGPLIEKEFNELPSFLKSSPAGAYIARANVMMHALARLAEKLTTDLNAAKTPANKPKPNGGPTGDDISGGGNTRGNGKVDTEVGFDDFKRVTEGY